jgi:hypothetical protein
MTTQPTRAQQHKLTAPEGAELTAPEGAELTDPEGAELTDPGADQLPVVLQLAKEAEAELEAG